MIDTMRSEGCESILKTCLQVVVGALLCCMLNAQRTWVVNAAGAGDFLDLPPAVAAASPGDTILVDRTLATPVSTAKGLAIVGYGGFLMQGLLRVHDLPAGQRFTLSNMSSQVFSGESVQLEFVRCKGRVEVTNCRGLRPMGATREPYLKIEDCDDVHFNEVEAFAVSVLRSRVRFVRSGIRGNEPGFSSVNEPGLLCIDSRIELSQCRVSGPASPYPVLPRPGVEMTGGRLLVAGDDARTQSWVANGITFGGPQRAYSPSILSNGGVVEIDPEVSVTDPQVPHLATVGSSQFIFRSTTWTEGGLAQVDRAFRPKLRVEAGALCGMFVSAHSTVIPTPFGEMWLDPATAINLGSGVAQSTTSSHGEWKVVAPLPKGLFKLGDSFTFQGISLVRGNLEFALPINGTIIWPKP